MHRPLIGITGRRVLGHRLHEVPDKLSAAEIDLHFNDYAERVHRAGGLPVQLTTAADPHAIVSRLDGLLLSGGADVDPALYGAEPVPELGVVEPDRDAFELTAIGTAMERRIPVLGICRGLQLLNVALGGTLTQHLAGGRLEHMSHEGPRTQPAHLVRFTSGSVAGGLYGAARWTTSLHHQAIDVLAADLLVGGRTSDRVIEAVEHSHLPVFGVQWHPEWHAELDPCFTWLVSTAKDSAGGEQPQHSDLQEASGE